MLTLLRVITANVCQTHSLCIFWNNGKW